MIVGQHVEVIQSEFVRSLQQACSCGLFRIHAPRVVCLAKVYVQMLSKDYQYETKFLQQTAIDFIKQQTDESAKDPIDGDSFDAIV